MSELTFRQKVYRLQTIVASWVLWCEPDSLNVGHLRSRSTGDVVRMCPHCEKKIKPGQEAHRRTGGTDDCPLVLVTCVRCADRYEDPRGA